MKIARRDARFGEPTSRKHRPRLLPAQIAVGCELTIAAARQRLQAGSATASRVCHAADAPAARITALELRHGPMRLRPVVSMLRSLPLRGRAQQPCCQAAAPHLSTLIASHSRQPTRSPAQLPAFAARSNAAAAHCHALSEPRAAPRSLVLARAVSTSTPLPPGIKLPSHCCGCGVKLQPEDADAPGFFQVRALGRCGARSVLGMDAPRPGRSPAAESPAAAARSASTLRVPQGAVGPLPAPPHTQHHHRHTL